MGLTGTTTLGQSEPRNNDNEGVFQTPHNWSRTIRCSLVSYKGHPISLVKESSYSSAGNTVSVF